MQLRAPTTGELERVERAREAYRAMWARLRSVPERTFDGGREDIDALNFIDYEAGEHPQGTSGAAMIWGGVLVKTGLFMWAIADDHDLVLVTTLDYPQVTIFPYARLAEIENSSWPAPSNAQRFDWLLEEVVLRLCAGGISGDQLRPVLALVDRVETLYWNAAKGALDLLTRPGSPERDNRLRSRKALPAEIQPRPC
jgi:hypothetical protein